MASSQWGVEPVAVLGQAMAREVAISGSSVLVGEASGGGVSAGQGITARVVPQSPGVGQLVRQFRAQSLPSVGTPEWRAGVARVSRDQQESKRDQEAMAAAIATKRPVGAGGSRFVVEPEDEDLTGARRVAAVGVKTVPAPPELDVKTSSGASGGWSGVVSAVQSEDVNHQLRPAGTPAGFSGEVKMSPPVGATQEVAARGSPGWDSSVLEGRSKAHRAALGGGEYVYPNMNAHPFIPCLNSQLTHRL